MVSVWTVILPSDTMASTRSNLTRPHLALDEQSFQGLLAAAFTIQEHNDQTRRTQPARTQLEVRSVCPQCGAPKPAEGSRCENCSRDQLRPGERLQRNWASMWLMSQEHDLWPGRSAEVDETVVEIPPKIGEVAQRAILPTEEDRGLLARDSTSNGLRALPVAREVAREKTEEHKAERAGDRALDRSVLDARNAERTLDRPAFNKTDVDSKRNTATSADWSGEDLAQENLDLTAQPLEFSETEDSFPTEASDDASNHVNQDSSRRWADWRVTLRFHRADLYLGAAVFVAVLALLWPAATPPQRAALGPWDRALISLGIAEAPDPAVHIQGDPAIEVWVDPHSALYYCPGEEQYGKTANGHFSSQHDAEMDRFEPAGRSACE
jgi:ribosomal protein L40E